MLFSSAAYLVFFPLVFILCWWLNERIRLRNSLLILAGLVFYGYWDTRFPVVLLGSILLNYFAGIYIAKTSGPLRRRILVAGIIGNLGILFYFKYITFFLSSFFSFSAYITGASHAFVPLAIILPLGLSFHILRMIGYLVDINRRQIVACKEPDVFLAFGCFFPYLLAGPIERAGKLIPQLEKKRIFNTVEASDGLRQVLWGLFKKMVIADNCAPLVDGCFADPTVQTADSLLLGLLFFSFQVYGDFSGYSDVAIGSARLLGFNLTQNFRTPYFAVNLADFWRRWHLSLNTWMRDYVYIPLGGNRVSRFVTLRNIFVVFVLSGLWHGAHYTFIVWGLVHAFAFIPLIYTGAFKRGRIASQPMLQQAAGMLFTFFFVVLARVFFRAPDLSVALLYLDGLFRISALGGILLAFREPVSIAVFFMLLMEWFSRKYPHGLSISVKLPVIIRYALYIVLVWLIFIYGIPEQYFVYLRF